jgi:Na+/H+ antiporter NhaD/arsenite permease-like protein
MSWHDLVATIVTGLGALLVGASVVLFVLRRRFRLPASGAAVVGTGAILIGWSPLVSNHVNLVHISIGSALVLIGISVTVGGLKRARMTHGVLGDNA